MRILVLLPLTAIAISASFGHCAHTESQALPVSVSYEVQEDRERFKQALSSAGIPYDVVVEQKNREFVRWSPSDSMAVQRVRDSLFVPSGRSISFGGAQQIRFQTWLQQQSIPFRTMSQNGREYIVWEDVDAERVRAWSEFPPFYDNPPATSHQ